MNFGNYGKLRTAFTCKHRIDDKANIAPQLVSCAFIKNGTWNNEGNSAVKSAHRHLRL